MGCGMPLGKEMAIWLLEYALLWTKQEKANNIDNRILRGRHSLVKSERIAELGVQMYAAGASRCCHKRCPLMVWDSVCESVGGGALVGGRLHCAKALMNPKGRVDIRARLPNERNG